MGQPMMQKWKSYGSTATSHGPDSGDLTTGGSDYSRTAGSLVGLAQMCGQHASATGYSYFIFLIWLPSAPSHPSVFALTNYPKAWLDLYRQRRFVQIDPVMQKLRCALVPFSWASIRADHPSVEEFFRDAKAHGLDNGIGLPLHGPGGVSAAFVMGGGIVPPPGRSLDQQFAESLLFSKRILNEALPCIRNQNNSGGALALTERQREVLIGVAEGLSYRDIAARLDIKPSTVKTLLERCCAKLGVVTREQAIIKALAAGYIDPFANLGLPVLDEQVAPYYVRAD